MHSKRLLDLLVIGLSALSVAEATFVNGRVNVRNVKAIQQRQADDDTPSPNPTPSETDTPPTPSPIPSSTPAPPKPSSQPPPPKPSEPSTPPAPDTTSKTTPPPDTPTSNKPNPPISTPTQPPPADTTPPPNPDNQEPSKPVIKTIISYETVTNSDGSFSTKSSEVVTTATPGLAENNNGGSGSGMTEETRNTVIGVVVGVGGAIILIALGFVAWRIWGRKKNQDEGLMDYSTPNDGKSEVGGSMSGRTPFQSTLESYHAPTQVNQAANF
ncbi:hypothetical protein V8F20_000723 [Naviculisporaceae sp. PSN 640]